MPKGGPDGPNLGKYETYPQQKEQFDKALEEADIDWDATMREIYELELEEQPVNDKEAGADHLKKRTAFEKDLRKILRIEKDKEKALWIDGLKADRYIIKVKDETVAYFKVKEKNEQRVVDFVDKLIKEIYDRAVEAKKEKDEATAEALTSQQNLKREVILNNLSELEDQQEHVRPGKQTKEELQQATDDLDEQLASLEDENKGDQKYLKTYAELIVQKNEQQLKEQAKLHMHLINEEMNNDLAELDSLIEKLKNEELSDEEMEQAWQNFKETFRSQIKTYGKAIAFFGSQDILDKLKMKDNVVKSLRGSANWTKWARRYRKLPKKYQELFQKTFPNFMDQVQPAPDQSQETMGGASYERSSITDHGPAAPQRPGSVEQTASPEQRETTKQKETVVDTKTGKTYTVSVDYVDFEDGREGIIKRIDLYEMPLQQLLDIEENISKGDLSIEAQTYRHALIDRIIQKVATPPDRSAETGNIKTTTLEYRRQELGDGSAEYGENRFWTLVNDVYMDESFKSSLNTNYTHSLSLVDAGQMDQYRKENRTYLTDYFELSDATTESGLLLNSFVCELAKKTGLPGTRLRYIFDAYRDKESNEFDPNVPANEIRERRDGKSKLGDASIGEMLWSGGSRTLTRYGTNELIKAGVLNQEQGAKVARAIDTAVKIAEKGFLIAGIFNGIRAAWKLGSAGVNKILGNNEAVSENLADSRKYTKLGALYGIGLNQATKFIQRPEDYWENNKLRKLVGLVDPTTKDELKKKEQIESGEIYSEVLGEKVVETWIGTLTPDQLLEKGILTQGREPNSIQVNADAFRDAFPEFEAEFQRTKDTAVIDTAIKKSAQSLENTFGLTWEKLKALQGKEQPLVDLLEERKNIIKKVEIYKNTLGSIVPQNIAEKLYNLEVDERSEIYTRLAFAAQQANKLFATDMKEAKLFANQSDSDVASADTFVEKIQAKLEVKDTDGQTAQQALENMLKQVVEGEKTVKDYYKLVFVVFNNSDNLEDHKEALYIQSEPFHKFIHNPHYGNTRPEGGKFVQNPEKTPGPGRALRKLEKYEGIRGDYEGENQTDAWKPSKTTWENML